MTYLYFFNNKQYANTNTPHVCVFMGKSSDDAWAHGKPHMDDGSGDLHPGVEVEVEDACGGPDLQGGADGEQAHQALRRDPHPAHVDALQPPALVHQRHQPALRHVAAAPQDDALPHHMHGK